MDANYMVSPSHSPLTIPFTQPHMRFIILTVACLLFLTSCSLIQVWALEPSMANTRRLEMFHLGLKNSMPPWLLGLCDEKQENYQILVPPTKEVDERGL